MGSVAVVYPKDEFDTHTDAVVRHIFSIALALLVLFSAAAWLLLRMRLSGAIHALSRLDTLRAQALDESRPAEPLAAMSDEDAAKLGFLRSEVAALETHLDRATAHYRSALSTLADAAQGIHDLPASAAETSGARETAVVSSPADTSLARQIARKLMPWAVVLIIGSAVVLGITALRAVQHSIEPEIANRTTLMGSVINANIQRAVSAGVPLDRLVGAERYLGNFLSEFKEVAYIGVASGRIILEAGERQVDVYGPRRSSKDAVAFPIESDGEQIGYIIIDVNSGYIAKAFENVLLDLAVVALVAILLAFEVLVVLLSVSLTAPFNRVQQLVTLQAAGDFSKRIEARGRDAIGQIGALLSERAEALHRLYERTLSRPSPAGAVAAPHAGNRPPGITLASGRPTLLLFSYLNDVRLPLFLFAAADELPLAFFPLFTRAASNPLPWLDAGVVISLPLAGYLLAIMFGSPLARPLAERVGHRNLILLATLPTIAAHVGLYFSSNVIEIVLYRSIAGLGYAIVTLACQDYVLDMTTPAQRSRSLGVYTGVLFAGIFCGTAMGGVLADRLGQDVVFLVSAALVLASGLLVYRLLPGRRPTPAAAAMPGRLRSATLWAPLRSRRFVALAFGIAVPANVMIQAFVSFLVALYLHDLGASAADTGRALMVYFLVIALMSPAMARVLDGRFAPEKVAALGATLCGLSLLVAALWASEAAIILALLGAGAGHAMVRDPQVSVAMSIAETELAHLGANAVLGSLRTLERGGSIIGLVLIALANSQFGYPASIGLVAGWVLLGAAAFAVSRAMTGGSHSHRTEERP